MNSDSDFPHQHNAPQQQPRSFKPLNWKVLLIVNVIFLLNVILFLLAVVYFFPYLLSALAIIDFIAVLFYIIQKQPRGKARIMWDAVLIVIGFVAVYYGVNALIYLGFALLL